MTSKEYADYEASVRAFFGREGIENLSSGHIRCPECNEEWTDGPGSYDECPNGHGHRDIWNEPSFSWRPCDCCGSSLGGNREHATGYHRERDEIREYEVCQDCVCYAEYGCLDDQTMMDIERD